MLKTAQASLIMSDMQGLLIKKLESEGYIFPSLILMSDFLPINISDLKGKYSCILNIECSLKMQDTYVNRVTFRNRDVKDDEEILRAIKDITFKYNPDAVGYFAQCLYKPMKKKECETLTTDSLNMDPEAIKVFHNCFFVKEEDVKGFLMVTPYILSENKNEGTFNFNESTKFTVTEVHRSWEVPTSSILTRIPNPYL